MKKNVCYLFSLVAVCLFMLSSCSSGSPSDVAKTCFEAMKSGNSDKLLDNLAGISELSDTEKKASKAMLDLTLEAAKKKNEEKDGIKDFEVLSEEIAEDGETAKVKIKTTYGDDSTDEETVKLVKEDGSWKMKMSK